MRVRASSSAKLSQGGMTEEGFASVLRDTVRTVKAHVSVAVLITLSATMRRDQDSAVAEGLPSFGSIVTC